MSKNITIQEGGVAKQLTVDKLKTNLVPSGACLWVPEDEVQLTTKTITENGTYRASDDGYYGYSEVIVSGQGTATGTDGDGDEAVAHTDPRTGELVIDKVPSSIRVITPPTNPYGIYPDGQAISTDGMVVKAYLASGELYTELPDGIVPNEQITLVPGVAAYDTIKDEGGGIIAMLDDPAYSEYNPPISAFHRLVSIADHVSVSPNTLVEKTAESDAYLVAYRSINSNTTFFVWMSTNQNDSVAITTRYNRDGQEEVITYDTIALSRQGTTNVSGTAFYYNSGGNIGWRDEVYSIPPHFISKATANINIDDIATIIFDGETTQIPAGAYQTITVSWPRPLDGKVLETTFEILVAPSPSGEGN